MGNFNPQKGHGFIESRVMQELYGKDIFFAASMIPGGWAEPGERVFFTIKMEQKGPAAATCEIVSGPPAGMGKGAYSPYQPPLAYGPPPGGCKGGYAPPPPPAPVAWPAPVPMSKHQL